MRVIPFVYDDYDDLFANSFILVDSDNNCVVIDPSKDYDGLVSYIQKNDLHLKAVLLTHGHFDHIRGVDRLVNTFNVPLYIGFEEIDYLTDPHLNCSRYMSEGDYVVNSKAITVSDGEILNLLNEPIECIFTPFHTKGSICYYIKDSKVLFTGDFLFKGSVGRSDLPGGDAKSFSSSIHKILSLPDDTKIYPGHGGFTTLENEKRTNYYLR